MNKNLKIGVVGCGYWGPNLIRNFSQAPNCVLKTLCDANEARLSHMRKLYPAVATTQKFEDLLQDPDLDAVVVATPVRFHYKMAKAALEAGKHVFIEKPMARTEAEG
ncbi:MAG TPA: Gfo/Idh/MocA family oxidoreductase, partial [Verrucomicrobiae bacterium]